MTFDCTGNRAPILSRPFPECFVPAEIGGGVNVSGEFTEQSRREGNDGTFAARLLKADGNEPIAGVVDQRTDLDRVGAFGGDDRLVRHAVSSNNGGEA